MTLKLSQLSTKLKLKLKLSLAKVLLKEIWLASQNVTTRVSLL